MEDLTGHTFGKLKVISQVANYKYNCICECGKKCTVSSYNLKSGKTKSCGCIKNVTKDLIGKEYGKLTIIAMSDKRNKQNKPLWECLCECGNTTYLSSAALTSGDYMSCGCMQDSKAAIEKAKKVLKEIAYLDNTNLLTIKKDTPNKNNRSGIRGVVKRRIKGSEYWYAYITVQGKTISLGYHNKIEDAEKARKEAEEKYFKPILEKYKELNDEL